MKNLLLLFSSMLYFTSVLAQESIYHYKLGNYELITLCEVQRTANTDILIGATEEMVEQTIPDGVYPNAVHAYLLRTVEKNILIDTGYGTNLFNNLSEVGIDREQIDIILITHMHGDHIGGMLKDDRINFPNAKVYIPQPEYNYWMSEEEMNRLPEAKHMGFRNAQQVVQAYKGKIELFQPSKLGIQPDDLLPGIKPIAAYGHTPGHTMYLVESNGERILVWGDLAHAMAIQMPYPEVAVTYDINPKEATSNREAVLKYINEYKIPVAGMHVPFPGMGNINASIPGYIFAPFQ